MENLQCPATGCPVDKLVAYEPLPDSRQQCVFMCDNVRLVNGNNQQDQNSISGRQCFEVTFPVRQAKLCCQGREQGGFPSCYSVNRNRGTTTTTISTNTTEQTTPEQTTIEQ